MRNKKIRQLSKYLSDSQHTRCVPVTMEQMHQNIIGALKIFNSYMSVVVEESQNN